MSQSNFEDQKLVAFLRQHKPIAPPPGIDLEKQILAQIEHVPLANQANHLVAATSDRSLRKQNQRSQLSKLNKGLWLLPAAIAISAGVFWANHRQPQFALSEAERLEIEAAMISSWSGSIDRDVETVIDPYAVPGNTELANGVDGDQSTGYSYDIYGLGLDSTGE
jgi:hypothetical protein